MPEGPSIIILKEAVEPFRGQRINKASGNSTKIVMDELKGKVIRDFKSWGKHFLVCFEDSYIRIHFLLFGSYRINERREMSPRLSLETTKGELNFYACSVQMKSGSPDDVYDWSADVMNPAWDPQKAEVKLHENGGKLACDALLDQDIFAGVGNIIKNEVLYRIRVHPASRVQDLPAEKLQEMIREAVNYSFDFLEWKKAFTLKAHWLAHTKTHCLRCDLPIRREYMGTTDRRTFFCNGCQVLYGDPPLPRVPKKSRTRK